MKLISKRKRAIAIFLLFDFLFQLCIPLKTYALTGGPSQPEVQSFEPVGTTDMVDLFTGDFNYNIPLLDVEGYPINISYHSGISMDQEASWVGLGWNINPGTINRSMRGLPDDFKGDEIHQTYDTKKHVTWGVNAGLAWELFGLDMKNKLKGKLVRKLNPNLSVNLGIKNDNYRGMGYSFGLTPVASIASENTEHEITTTNTFRLGLNFDSQDGATVSPNYSHSTKISEHVENGSSNQIYGQSTGLTFNSRRGFTSLTLGLNKSKELEREGIKRVTSGEENGVTFLTQNHLSYQPSAKQKLSTFSASLNFKTGIELFGTFPELDLGGYFSSQWYEKDRKVFGYGCLYNDAKPEDGFLQDFNRFNEGSYTKDLKNLPLSTLTPDYFSVSGQGISGSYKIKHSYVPVVYDDEVSSNSTNIGIGAELGPGNTVKWGINVNPVFTSNRSGVKKLQKQEKQLIGNQTQNLPGDYQKSYFKFVGEKTPVDASYYDLMNKRQVVDPETFLDSINDKTGRIRNPYEAKTAIQKEREKRNQVFQYLTVDDIQKVPELALDQNIKSYPLNSLEYLWSTSSLVQPASLNRSDLQNSHHISEVTVLSDDGRRYVYGIPAMNNTQEEYTFSLPLNPTVTNQIATYPVSGSDIVYQHDKVNYMYHKQEMPKYAYSYLLTGLLSDDYIDRTSNGITDDDYGTAVKFNYTRIKHDYKWRTPYNQYSANYQEGNKSNPTDNKCSFVYGTKDIWYMHSVETKNFVAVFILSKREDGLGVVNTHGAKNTNDTLMKLDKIVLYSKSDLQQNHTSAVPIKTVHFVYDYSQCKSVDNNTNNVVMVNSIDINANHGKLTLKKIYFTYGNSNKGMYTSYRFSYSEPNPDYNIKGYDRWGNYSPFSAGNSTTPNNAEWPFTTQIKADADNYASAWNLNKIELPTGGVISVTYESDDYAYVQNRQAQMMLKIEDIGSSSSDYHSSVTSGFLYDKSSTSGSQINKDYLFFKIPSTSVTIPIKEYFKGIDEMFFNIRSVIRDKYGKKPEEDIMGFCQIEKDNNNDPLCGVVSGHADIGWVKVKEVSIKDNDEAGGKQIQPMAKQAFIYALQNSPEWVYPSSNPNATGQKAIKGLFTSMGEMVHLFKHFYTVMRDRKYCQEVILDKSYIRVNCASHFKMGGGTRVKKIELDDKWASMKNSSNSHVTSSSYGQQYSYTTMENGVEISSGVAQWEPSTGSEENPFKLPNWEIRKRFLGRDEKILHIEPFADAMYPSANVGYSSVTVKSLGGKTGRTETLFYTAKDFPTRVEQTSLDKNTSDNGYFNIGKKVVSEVSKQVVKQSKFLSKFGLSVDYNFLKVQQGYSIINNDMHGKMKEQHIYPEGSNIARSSVKYKYKTDPLDPSKLVNSVLTYDYQNNQVRAQEVALDYDVSYDKQAEESLTCGVSAQFNIDVFAVPPMYVSSFSFFPAFSFEKDNFRYAVVTKQINQYGILESTEAYEDGSTINTQNLLYDAHTGEILLTQTQNEYNDKIYNLDFPAHFVYDGMGQAYRNLDVSIYGLKIMSGRIRTADPADQWKISSYLSWGDEVELTQWGVFSGHFTAIYTKAWVYAMKDGDHCLIDKNGNIIYTDNRVDIKVKRSGRRNMQNIPVEKITMLKNPLVYSSGSWSLNIDQSNILNVSASTFSDQWQTFCDPVSYKKCNTETAVGNAVKVWLSKIIKLKEMTQDRSFTGDELLPDSLKNYPFCTSPTSAADNYHVDTGNVISLGRIGYQFRIGSGSPCCQLTLSSNYQHCVTYASHLYAVMFGPNKSTYKISDVDYPIDDLELFTDSIKTRDSCVYEPLHDIDTCFTIGDTFKYCYVPKSIYDTIAPTYTAGDVTYSNYLYKKIWNWDSLGCTNLRYDSVNAESIYPVWADTTTFQMNTDTNNFKMLVTLNNGKQIWLNGSFGECHVKLFKDCCQECQPQPTRVINPYLESVRGTWRKKADYAFHAKRKISTASSVVSPTLRKDGVFDDFQHFWQYSSLANAYTKNASTSNWIKASEVNAYTPYGNEIEDVDALGIYSAALFAYHYKLPVAVAKNSKYTQMTYDGFEDYGMFSNAGDCAQSHWSFEWSGVNGMIDTIAHSGKYSLGLLADSTKMVSRKVMDCSTPNLGVETDEYSLDACNCIKKFAPDTGDYLISGWVREGHDSAQALTTAYTHANITVKLKRFCEDTGIVYVFKADGPVIEQWQRIEGKFHLPKGYPLIEVYLNAPAYKAWFDDLRIHPWLGNMKSYAYDKISLKLMAELDENNFATFYEYDKEGQLMRVKKETVKGIVTLKEVREHSSNRK